MICVDFFHFSTNKVANRIYAEMVLSNRQKTPFFGFVLNVSCGCCKRFEKMGISLNPIYDKCYKSKPVSKDVFTSSLPNLSYNIGYHYVILRMRIHFIDESRVQTINYAAFPNISSSS